MSYKYITVEEAIRLNGDRHLQRANRYLADENFEFAEGSLAKAEKNYSKANILRIDPIFDNILKDLSDRIADSILNGISK